MRKFKTYSKRDEPSGKIKFFSTKTRDLTYKHSMFALLGLISHVN